MKIMKPRIYFQSEKKKSLKKYIKNKKHWIYLSSIDGKIIVNGERKLLQDALVEVWNQVDDVSIDYETIISPTVIPYQEYMKWKEDIPYYHNIDKEGIRVA